MKKWKTAVEFRYNWTDAYEESHYESKKQILGVFDNERDAYNIANEFYDKTKHLYKYPIDCRFGERYAFSKKNIDILKIPESSTKKRVSSVSVLITVKSMNFLTMDECLEFMSNEILK